MASFIFYDLIAGMSVKPYGKYSEQTSEVRGYGGIRGNDDMHAFLVTMKQFTSAIGGHKAELSAASKTQ